MRIISKEQLKNKMDHDEQFKLVMTMNDWAFDQMHIPGSMHFENVCEAMSQLNPNDEIILYCSAKECHYGIDAYLALRECGYSNIYYYPGGLQEWMSAHYPLEGNMAH